ncbi:hypothetical protein [Sinomonas sp. P47F7]|uniref:hypothetical protein n=1 Tax=Sinomonas sp. P47F7 TaxID=3410987 RepID=UPI003BF50B8C
MGLHTSALKSAERLRTALLTVRQFDATGNADLAIEHLRACEGEVRAAIRALIDGVDTAYAVLDPDDGLDGPRQEIRFVDEVHQASAEATERPAEPLSEPIQSPAPLSEPIKPEPSVSAGGRVALPIGAVVLEGVTIAEAGGRGVPSPADVARLDVRRVMQGRWRA